MPIEHRAPRAAWRPRPRNGAAAVALLFAGGLLLWLWARGFVRGNAEIGRTETCREHMEALGMALLQYSTAHGGRFPKADTWVDDIRPYLRDPFVLKCPADGSPARCSYALNASIADTDPTELEQRHPDRLLVVLYETERPGISPAGTGADECRPGRHLMTINPNPGFHLNRLADLERGNNVVLGVPGQVKYVLDRNAAPGEYLQRSVLPASASTKLLWR